MGYVPCPPQQEGCYRGRPLRQQGGASGVTGETANQRVKGTEAVVETCIRPARRLAIVRHCPTCDSSFQPWNERQRYCSNACAQKGLWREAKTPGRQPSKWRHTGYHRPVDCICTQCGQPWTATRNRVRGNRYCSRACREAGLQILRKEWQAQWPRTLTPILLTSRPNTFSAREVGVSRYLRGDRMPAYNPLRRVSLRHLIAPIAERDGHCCHICQRLVATRDRSLDHLVPWSQGGSDEPFNLRLAHRRCNSRRGAGRLPAQLQLEAMAQC